MSGQGEHETSQTSIDGRHPSRGNLAHGHRLRRWADRLTRAACGVRPQAVCLRLRDSEGRPRSIPPEAGGSRDHQSICAVFSGRSSARQADVGPRCRSGLGLDADWRSRDAPPRASRWNRTRPDVEKATDRPTGGSRDMPRKTSSIWLSPTITMTTRRTQTHSRVQPGWCAKSSATRCSRRNHRESSSLPTTRH